MLSSWSAVRLVAEREVSTRWRGRAFRIMSAIMLLAVIGVLVAMKLAAGDGAGSKNVGFTAQASALAQPFVSTASAVDAKVSSSIVDQAAGEEMLRNGDLDALVTGTPDNFTVEVKRDLNPQLNNAFQVLTRQIVLSNQITQLGGNPSTVAGAVASAHVTVTPLEDVPPFSTQRLALGIISAILVYVAVLTYGQLVAQGVVEEKSSRVVELLLTAIRPWQLMLGKVFGIGLLGLAQLIVIGVVGVVAGLQLDVIQFPTSLAAGAVAMAIVWFLVGYIMYALIFAALGSLVSRQEDVSSVVTPVIMVLVVPYVLTTSLLPSNPTSGLMRVLSLIPLFSPTVMPTRAALGVAPAWEVGLSLVLCALFIVALVWLGGRMYRNAILRMGSRVSLKEALRASA